MIEGWELALVFVAGLLAGFVDSVAGGGGMITLPVLLSFGLPPQLALGTNKLQAVFGSASAAIHYARCDAAVPRDCVAGFFYSFVGAAMGTLAVRQIDPGFLRLAIPCLLIAVAIYMLAQPKLGETDSTRRLNKATFDLLAGLGLGFYDGFFGPGTGTFWTMALMMFLGLNMVRATGNAKVMNFGSNLGSLIFFTAAGQVLLLPGLVMGVAQMIGARIGAGMVVTRGRAFIRPLFLTMVLAIALKLLWSAAK
jgi:uncharacterized membrane protein YfcA